MKKEQKQPKETEKDELLDLAFEQKEETTPRTLRVNTEQEKQTIHVTTQNN